MPGHRLIVLAAAAPGGMRKYRCRPACGVATVSVSGQGCPYTRHSAAKTATPSGPPPCRSRSRPTMPEARQPTYTAAAVVRLEESRKAGELAGEVGGVAILAGDAGQVRGGLV